MTTTAGAAFVPASAPTTAAEYAAMLIEDITTNGHYRGINNTQAELLDAGARPSCVVSNKLSGYSIRVLQDFRHAFAQAAGISYYEIVEWNDAHSTEEVLAVLRKIANPD